MTADQFLAASVPTVTFSDAEKSEFGRVLERMTTRSRVFRERTDRLRVVRQCLKILHAGGITAVTAGEIEELITRLGFARLFNGCDPIRREVGTLLGAHGLKLPSVAGDDGKLYLIDGGLHGDE